MTKLDKLLLAMRNNPRGDWSIDDLKSLAKRFEIDWRQPGTSHVTFSFDGIEAVTVPAHKPVKAIYVIRFLGLLDKIARVASEVGDETGMQDNGD
jgi:hypothetical protein